MTSENEITWWISSHKFGRHVVLEQLLAGFGVGQIDIVRFLVILAVRAELTVFRFVFDRQWHQVAVYMTHYPWGCYLNQRWLDFELGLVVVLNQEQATLIGQYFEDSTSENTFTLQGISGHFWVILGPVNFGPFWDR